MSEILFQWAFGIDVFRISNIKTDLIKIGDYVDIKLDASQKKQLDSQFDGWKEPNVRGKIFDREVLIDGDLINFRFLAELIMKEEEDDSEWIE